MKLPNYLFEHKPVNRAAKPHVVFALTLSGLESMLYDRNQFRPHSNQLSYDVIHELTKLSMMISSWHSTTYWFAVAANVRYDADGQPAAFAGPFPPEFHQYALHASAFLEGKQVAATIDRPDKHGLSPEVIADLPLNLITLEMPDTMEVWRPGFHGAIQRDWI